MFVEVAGCGSFAEASRRLRVPSATVSRRIQQLEVQLGTRLMQRSTRKLTLTGAGLAFKERCSPAVLELMGAGLRQVTESQEPSGVVRVAAPASFFKFFKMEWVNAFLDEHPLVKLEFVLSDRVADLIDERIDIAFRGGPLADSSYVARKIFANYGGLFASPSYLARHGEPNTLRELPEHHCVITPPDAGNFATWRLEGPDGDEEDVKVKGRFISNSQDVLRQAACAGLGIAALPSIIAVGDVESGNLIPVLPRYKRAGRGLSVIYTSRQQLPQAVSAFIDMAVKKLGQQEWGGTTSCSSEAPKIQVGAGRAPIVLPRTQYGLRDCVKI